MDLYISDTTLKDLARIFQSLEFKVTREKQEGRKYMNAVLECPNGRYHAMFAWLERKIYCDFHYDYTRHKWFLGEDYEKRPREFFEKHLRKIMEKRNIKFEIKRVTWFTRRNKAKSGGFKL